MDDDFDSEFRTTFIFILASKFAELWPKNRNRNPNPNPTKTRVSYKFESTNPKILNKVSIDAES